MQRVLQSNNVKLAIEANHEIDGGATYKTVILELEKMHFKVCEENKVVYASKNG